MICQTCGHESMPTETVRGVTICPECLASVIADTGQRANGRDTMLLTIEEIKALKAVRKQLREAKGTVR